MNAIIIDDERLARSEIRRLLQSFPEIQIVAEASNCQEAKQAVAEHDPDLLFLDIKMPGKSGFDLLEEIDPGPAVIFTTAYDEFAIRTFEVNALDYLLKPIEPKRLQAALAKVFESKPAGLGDVAANRQIVNLKKVATLEPWPNGGIIAVIKGGHKVEMSRRRARQFKEAMSL